MVTPVLAGAGGALAGGIAAGQGFWEYAPNTGTMSEADALAKVKEDSTLKTAAEKELASLKEKQIDEIIESQLKFDENAYIFNHPSATEDEKIALMNKKRTEYKNKMGTTLESANLSDLKKPLTNYLAEAKDHLEKSEKTLEEENDELYKEDLIKRIKWYKEEVIPYYDNMLKHLETYEKLDLKDTPSVQKLTKASLKTATQKMEGFMKWGYAKAEELEAIGGEELVKHANSSKIALGAGALVAGAGVGTLAYFLLNKPKSTTAKPPSAE